jgi:hypothetical protein
MTRIKEIDTTRRGRGQNYTPAENGTINANATLTLTFRPRQGRDFGISRILPFASNALSDITCDLQTSDGEITLFSNVHLSAVRRLFLYRTFDKPLRLPSDRSLDFHLTEHEGNQQRVEMVLAGYDGPQYWSEVERLRQQRGPVQEPRFVYGNVSLNAGASRQTLALNHGSDVVYFHRFQVGSDSIGDIRLELTRMGDVVKQMVAAEVHNDEFLFGQGVAEYAIGKNDPIEAMVTNVDSGSSHEASFIAEAYRLNNPSEILG